MTTGTPGNDNLQNSPSNKNDTVSGLAGDDVITVTPPFGSGWVTTVDGGSGFDILQISNAVFNSADANGIIVGGSSSQRGRVAFTGIERVILSGTVIQQSQSFTGGDEEDWLTFQFVGMFPISTGGGNDRIVLVPPSNFRTTEPSIDAGTGDDYVDASAVSPDEFGQATIHGGDGNDVLIGTRGRDFLMGDAGDDYLDAGLFGSPLQGINDWMEGGTGNDIYVVRMTAVTLVENAGEGEDEVRTDLSSYTLLENFERLTGFSTGNQSLTGNAADNVITVSTGTTTVDGAGGRDRLVIDATAAASAVTLSPVTINADGLSGSASWSTGSTNYQRIEDITIMSSKGNYADTVTTGNGNDVFYHYGINDPNYLMDTVDLGDGDDLGVGDFSAVTDYQVTTQLLPNGHFLMLVNGGGKLELINTERVDITGGALGDTFSGFGGNDVLRGGGGDDTLYGGLGNDTLDGGVGNDSLNGEDGDDILKTSVGNDGAAGGAGIDTLVVNYSAATTSVTGGAANGYFTDSNGNQVSFSGIEKFDVTTGSANDSVNTGAGDDVVRLGAGDDFANVGSGNDSGDGGTGVDGISADLSAATGAIAWNLVANTYSGPAGSAFTNFEYFGTLSTGSGNDTIVTGAGAHDETINTGDGNDTIKVFGGSDGVNGGTGTDTLIVDYSDATGPITGGAQNGYLTDSTSAHTVSFSAVEKFDVTTGSGNDSINTGAGDDVVHLGLGNDFVNVGAGNDTADGGGGVDGISADLSAAAGAIAWNLVANTYSGSVGSFTNFEYFGTLSTGSGNDTIVSGTGAHDETISTGDGDDSIKVFGGSDGVNGGTGTDTLIVDYSDATGAITAGAQNGYFTDGTSAHTVSFSAIERFDVTTGSGNDSINTGAGDDVVHLGLGDDFVSVGGGNDLADGGAGIDGISADLSAATGAIAWNLVANTYSGSIRSFANFEYFGTISTGSGNDTIVTGTGAHDESISTGDGDDSIKVFGGSDSVNGGTGTDTLVVDYSDSVNAITGGAQNGYLTDGSSAHNVNFSAIERFDVTTGGANDSLNTGSGDDVVHSGGGADQVDVGSGNDIADGGDGIDRISANLSAAAGAIVWDLVANNYSGPIGSFTNFEYFGTISTGGGDDTIVSGIGAHDESISAGGGNDTIAVFGGSDNVDGGAGNDTLIADYSGATNGITGGAANGYFTDGSARSVSFSGVENFQVTGGASNDTLNGGAGNDKFFGNDGADSLSGGGGDDYLDGGTGSDTMTGGTGNDVYVVDSLGDTVNENANEGVDEIRTTLSTFALSANLEKLTFTGTGDSDLRGNAADNAVTGAAGADFIRLQDGGNDSAFGGAGNDAFYFGAAFTAADRVDGGDGKDVVALQGDYSTGVTLDALSLTNVETLALLTHGDNRFGGQSASPFSYNIVTVDGNVAAGQQLIVNASTLEAGENLFFDGHAETDGGFFIYGGKGIDILGGGGGVDVFFFAEDGRFGSADFVNGGDGNDIVVLRGDYDLTFTGTQMINVETVTLMSGADSRFYPAGTDFHYSITTSDQTVAFGATMTFNGGTLGSEETLYFNGSAETNGNFRVFAGAADDTLTGGAGNDTIFGGLGADQLTGGFGNDLFRYQNAAESTSQSMDYITDFMQGDKIDVTRVDIDPATPGYQHFTFIGSDAFDGHAGQLRVEYGGDDLWFVQGDTDGDGNADLTILVYVADNATHSLGANDFLL